MARCQQVHLAFDFYHWPHIRIGRSALLSNLQCNSKSDSANHRRSWAILMPRLWVSGFPVQNTKFYLKSAFQLSCPWWRLFQWYSKAWQLWLLQIPWTQKLVSRTCGQTSLPGILLPRKCWKWLLLLSWSKSVLDQRRVRPIAVWFSPLLSWGCQMTTLCLSKLVSYSLRMRYLAFRDYKNYRRFTCLFVSSPFPCGSTFKGSNLSSQTTLPTDAQGML